MRWPWEKRTIDMADVHAGRVTLLHDGQPVKFQKRRFDAAQFNRLTADWFAPSTAADIEIRNDLTTLRNRSRDMERNNPYYAGIIQTFADNIAGRGILPEPRIERNGVRDDVLNDAIKEGWWLWGKAKYCHAQRSLPIGQIERQIVRSWWRDGEVFLRFNGGYSNGSGVPLTLNVLEADYCDHLFDGVNQETGYKITSGVEHTEFGTPVAYWLYRQHPGNARNLDMRRVRVDAREIVHVYVPYRPGQMRGFPEGAVALLRLKHLGGYEESEMVAARTAAAKMGFFYSDDGTPLGEDTQGKTFIESAPGTFEYLPPGVKFQGWDPQHPSGNMDPFVKTMLRGAAAGLSVSYETFSKDYTDTTFFSARMSTVSERDLWGIQTDWLSDILMSRIYEEHLRWGVIAGKYKIPDFMERRDFYVDSCDWLGRGYDWVDPLKEIEADAAAVRYGFKTRTEVLAKRGKDFKDTIKALAEENKQIQAAGLTLDTDGKLFAKLLDAAIAQGDGDEQSPEAEEAARNMGGKVIPMKGARA